MLNPSSVFNPNLQSAKDKTARQDNMSDATPPLYQMLMQTNWKWLLKYSSSVLSILDWQYSKWHPVSFILIGCRWCRKHLALTLSLLWIRTRMWKPWAHWSGQTPPSTPSSLNFIRKRLETPNDARRHSSSFIEFLPTSAWARFDLIRLSNALCKNSSSTYHKWTENNWETTRIGWITTINPINYIGNKLNSSSAKCFTRSSSQSKWRSQDFECCLYLRPLTRKALLSPRKHMRLKSCRRTLLICGRFSRPCWATQSRRLSHTAWEENCRQLISKPLNSRLKHERHLSCGTSKHQWSHDVLLASP